MSHSGRLLLPRRRVHLIRLACLALALLSSGCNQRPERLTYDDEGVAHDVLALIPHNVEWARTIQYDALLYRIELRTDALSDRAPTDALYSFYSPGSHVFLTATSDPRTPWEGAEPQEWPAGQRTPMPLPPVTVDFDRAWQIAHAAGITQVSSAVLDVNQKNGLPLVAWSITGTLRDQRERGVYIDALTGDRLYQHTLDEPPISPTSLETAQSRYRGALRATLTGTGGCKPTFLPVPASGPVVCFDPVRRVYSPLP